MTPSGFLLDMGISPRVGSMLAQRGCSARHVQDIGQSEAADPEILHIADRMDSVVIATDKGLASHVAKRQVARPSVITLRPDNPSAAEQIAALDQLLNQVPLPELGACLITIDLRGHRRRALPVVR